MVAVLFLQDGPTLMDGEDCFLRPLKRHSDPFHIDGGNEDTPKYTLCIKTNGVSE